MPRFVCCDGDYAAVADVKMRKLWGKNQYRKKKRIRRLCGRRSGGASSACLDFHCAFDRTLQLSVSGLFSDAGGIQRLFGVRHRNARTPVMRMGS